MYLCTYLCHSLEFILYIILLYIIIIINIYYVYNNNIMHVSCLIFCLFSVGFTQWEQNVLCPLTLHHTWWLVYIIQCLLFYVVMHGFWCKACGICGCRGSVFLFHMELMIITMLYSLCACPACFSPFLPYKTLFIGCQKVASYSIHCRKLARTVGAGSILLARWDLKVN